MAAGSALIPYRDALDFVLSRVSLVSAQSVPLADALGKPLGERIVATAPIPPRALAGRRGIAVASQELVGASSYSPVFLASRPALVMPGDPLPPSADAVIEEQAVASSHGTHEVGQTAYPGEGAILAGADCRGGAIIAEAGAIVTPTILLALSLSGTTKVAIRSPAVYVGDTDGRAQAEANWLRSALVEAGCMPTTSETSDLRIIIARDPYAATAASDHQTLAGLALNPGRDTLFTCNEEGVTIVFSARFDAVVAGFHALVMPAVAAMTGRRLRLIDKPLAGKLVSQVGFADVALLRSTAAGYEPLATGALSLEALINADAVAIVPPEGEGAAAGTSFSAVPLKDPFEAA